MATTKKKTTEERAGSKKRTIKNRGPAGGSASAFRNTFRSVRLTCVYSYGDDRWWGAEVLGAKGVYSQGRTLNSAKVNLREAIELMLAEAPEQFPVRARRAPRNTESLVSEFIWATVPT